MPCSGAAPAAAVVASPVGHPRSDLAAQIERLTGQRARRRSTSAAGACRSSCPDHDEEVRWVARTIIQLVTGPKRSPPTTSPCCTRRAPRTPAAVRDELERSGAVHERADDRDRSPDRWQGRPCGCCSTPSSEGVRPRARAARHRRRAGVAVRCGPRRNAAHRRRLCREAGIVRAADWDVAVERLADAQRARRERPRRSTQRIEPTEPTERDRLGPGGDGHAVRLAQRLAAAGARCGRRVPPSARGPRPRRARRRARPATSDRTSGASCTGPTPRSGNAAPPNRSPRCSPRSTQFDQPHTRCVRSGGAATGGRGRARSSGPQGGRRVARGCAPAAAARHLPRRPPGLPRRLERRRAAAAPHRRSRRARDRPPECAAVVEHADWYRRRLRRGMGCALLGGAAPSPSPSPAPTCGEAAPPTDRRGCRTAAERHEHGSHAAGLRSLPPLTAAEAAARRGDAPRRVEHAAATGDRPRQPHPAPTPRCSTGGSAPTTSTIRRSARKRSPASRATPGAG